MAMQQSDILAVGLNPAWQKTLFFDHLVKGEVNRATRLLESGGGKAINFARALRSTGRITVLQFAGGHTGDFLCGELDEHVVPHLTVRTRQRTRVCSTAVCQTDGSSTELIEPAAAVSQDEVQQLRSLLTTELERFDGIALCGTFPPGVPDDLYAQIAARARPRAVVLLDAYRDVTPALRQGVDVLKINTRELLTLTAESSLEDAARTCLQEFRVRYLAVTQGGDPAYLFAPEQAWRIRLPSLPRFVNAIGAGDCASAVMLAELVDAVRDREHDLPGAGPAGLTPSAVRAAFERALACAAASCLTPVPGTFDPDDVPALREGMSVEAHPFHV